MSKSNSNGWLSEQPQSSGYPDNQERVGKETSSTHIQRGNVTEAHPTDDLGADAGTGHVEFDGAKDTHHRHIPNQSLPTPGRRTGTQPGDGSRYEATSQSALQHPESQTRIRTRKENPAVTAGTHTTSESQNLAVVGHSKEQEDAKMAIFGKGRGGADVRMPNANDARKFPGPTKRGNGADQNRSFNSKGEHENNNREK